MCNKELNLFIVTRKDFARLTENWSHELSDSCFLVLNRAFNYRQTHLYIYWFSGIRVLADGASRTATNTRFLEEQWHKRSHESVHFIPLSSYLHGVEGK